MPTSFFTDAELICFNHDVITIIINIENQHQRADINSIHKRIMKIRDFHVSKEFLNIRREDPLDNRRIRNNSFSHVETPSPEYSLQTPNFHSPKSHH